MPQPSAQASAAGRRERRIATHGQVWHLKGEGWTAEAIGRHLGISRASVFPLGALLRSRNLRHEVFPERGRRDGRGLSRVLRRQGCKGSDATPSLPPAARAGRRAGAGTALVRDCAPDRLDPWLKRAADGAVRQLQRFARRLSADCDAVRAALTLTWSNGPAEGQINRLKTLKRQMHGRVSLDLLERRFLLAA